MRKKRPPKNRARCCVGSCNNHTVLFYLQDYPVCEKHYSDHCDNKFKYKHFRSLREYLGFPPISKPEGKEHLDEECFAYQMEICIDVEMNVPVLMDESLAEWDVSAESVKFEPQTVKWNGKKEDPIELYVEDGGAKTVLLFATGKAVKFSSEKAILAAMDKLQEIVAGMPQENWGFHIQKKFKKSKFWQVGNDFNKEV